MIKPAIPTCMSTQHPDNVTPPFFAESLELGGEDEVQEAYYAFSHLGCEEQMWDCEGKEVDSYVVKKLLTKYESFFKNHRLGENNFITLRVPNPTVERAEAKILLETLESIPRSFDAARLFYGNGDAPPIFEVILPMTASSASIDRIYRYYADFIIGRQTKPFKPGDITIQEWIGEFGPATINVIPLFEDREHMLNAHEITAAYLSDKRVPYQRVFLARSDPAMNYGLLGAVLFNKIALKRLWDLSRESGVDIHPIIGVGSAPFRGNLTPHTVRRVLAEYPSARTFTIQSSFKYDHPPDEVQAAVAAIRTHTPSIPPLIDEERGLEIIDRYSQRYREQIAALAPVINDVARFVPNRRKRKLHIGLFGYARELEGITLPRAIKFTAALYSIGLPPELLGLDALTDDDIAAIKTFYRSFTQDIGDALRYANLDSSFAPKGVFEAAGRIAGGDAPDAENAEMAGRVERAVIERKTESAAELVLQAAHLRRFLG